MTFKYSETETESKLELIEGGFVVGYIYLEKIDNRFQVWDTEVIESHRGKGLATKMYNKLKQELSNNNIFEFYSDVEFSSDYMVRIYNTIGGELVDVDSDRRYKVEF